MSTQSPSLRLKPSCVPHPTLKSQRYPLISAILQARIILQNQNQKLFLWPNNFSLFSCDQAALWTVLSIRLSSVRICWSLCCYHYNWLAFNVMHWPYGPVIWNEILKNINPDTSVVSFDKLLCHDYVKIFIILKMQFRSRIYYVVVTCYRTSI